MAEDIAHVVEPVIEVPPERAPAPSLHELWWGFPALAVAACTTLTLALWVSTHVEVSPAVRNAALFMHLGSLVLGFGAVLIADHFLLLWLLGRTTFAETMSATRLLHLPVWTGLTGLVVSGTLLNPVLSSGLTQLKLGFVFALTLNGLQLPILGRRMADSAGTPSRQLLAWGIAATTISQICWWGAVWIGLWNTTHSA
jgi:hypothetical protein